MIHLTNFFTILQKNTPANIAKKRLKIIVAKYKPNNTHIPNYLPQLKKDLIKVICKYAHINSKSFSFQLGKQDNNTSILELHVTLNKIKKSKN